MEKQRRKLMKALVIAFSVLTLVMAPAEAAIPFNTVVTAEAAVKMSSSKATMVRGQKKTLKVKGTSKKAKWSTSNKKVATVSSKGVVTAKGKGTATITAKVGKKKYTCKVTVQVPKLSKSSATIYVNKTLQLKVSGTSQKVKWSTSNKKVATVSSKGKVTAKATGKANITANINGVKLVCKVTVKKASTSTSAKQKANQTLKNYIQSNGYTNSDGDKFIVTYDTVSGTEFQCGIVYNRKTNQFNYIIAAENDAKGFISTLMMITSLNPTTAKTEFIYAEDAGGFMMKANFNMSSYKTNSTLKFTVTKTEGGTTSYTNMNNAANGLLQSGMRGWSQLAKKAGVSMKSLGFSSYNG